MYEEAVKRMFQVASVIFLRSDYMKIACFELKSPNPPPTDIGSGRCFGAILLCVFLLFGCDILKDPGVDPGDEDIEVPVGGDPGGTDPAPLEPVGGGDPAEGEENNHSIKAKFGITTLGITGVKDTFNALHDFIDEGGLEDNPPVIQLGDWIDLEGGIEVAAYGGDDGAGGGYFNLSAVEAVQEVTLAPPLGPVPNGTRGRLIVVGINSFRSGKGYEGNYAETKNDGVDHVVFQFQNTPVERRMNRTDTNAGGYAESEVRKYLVGSGSDGNFLTGLTNAGVPQKVLWGPNRIIACGPEGTATKEISDLLWLPTQREMFGWPNAFSGYAETEVNQARLEYYFGGIERRKGSHYWLSSPSRDNYSQYFFYVGDSGDYAIYFASRVRGIAPAFCVQ
jgi:hypothetical protein